MIGLTQTATVYTRAASGAYTTVAHAALPVRLCHVSQRGARSSEERAELASVRLLLWGPATVLPEVCRLTVDGESWQPVPGTFGHVEGPLSYRRCDVRRAD